MTHEITLNTQEIIALRRHFHEYPELSHHEKKTARKISEFLSQHPIEFKTGIAGNGIIGRIKGKGSGPIIALRADMDALPVQDEKPVSYHSKIPNVMHACGHDGHMAMLLGAAAYLAEHSEKLKGEVRLIFQPAEEVQPGGALQMIEAGCLEGVEAVYGLHLWSGLPIGTIGTRTGPIMASADFFTIRIQGKGGHGAIPQEAIDAVIVGTQVVNQFQEIISRRISPLAPCVLTVGTFNAGSTYNVIADSAELKGTVRCFTPGVRQRIQELMRQTLEGICSIYGASYEFDYVEGCPPVINHPESVNRVLEAAKSLVDPTNVKEMEMLMVGEDFGRYLEHVPGCLTFIGSGNPQKESTYPHHHPKFDLDEDALEMGAKLLVRLVLGHLVGA